MKEKIEIINGVTVKYEVEKNENLSHLDRFNNLPEMVDYMTRNDVVYKPANIGEYVYRVGLEKTDEANENWSENEMRIKNRHFPQPELPTNMWK